MLKTDFFILFPIKNNENKDVPNNIIEKSFQIYAIEKRILNNDREQFYTLSKENSTPTCFVQFGIRSEITDIFNKKNIINPLNKKKFFVDYMLTFNEAIGKKYKKFIKGKNYAIGSFKNNMWPSKNKTKIDKTIVFVSSYRANKEKNDTFK